MSQPEESREKTASTDAEQHAIDKEPVTVTTVKPSGKRGVI